MTTLRSESRILPAFSTNGKATPAPYAIRICGRWIDVQTPRCEMMTFEPQMCEEILRGHNNHNRPLRRSRAQRYAEDMRAGAWQVNGETVKFAASGELLDGQTRLMGCVLSGVPFTTWAAFGLDADAFQTIDGGISRTAGDALAIDGEANATNLAATLALVWLDERGKLEQVGKAPSTPILLDVLARHPGIREACGQKRRLLKDTFLHPRVATFCLYRFGQLDPDAARRFFEDLRLGAGLPAGDPVLALRNRLVADKIAKNKPDTSYVLAIVIKAWNYRRQGRTIRHLRWRTEGDAAEDFPRIL